MIRCSKLSAWMPLHSSHRRRLVCRIVSYNVRPAKISTVSLRKDRCSGSLRACSRLDPWVSGVRDRRHSQISSEHERKALIGRHKQFNASDRTVFLTSQVHVLWAQEPGVRREAAHTYAPSSENGVRPLDRHTKASEPLAKVKQP